MFQTNLKSYQKNYYIYQRFWNFDNKKIFIYRNLKFCKFFEDKMLDNMKYIIFQYSEEIYYSL